ncbi:DUF3618 domain-containing protein [Streptomyces sp. NPDC059104]|uniref:DUF3618 domain-containing protein n=1 Tax=Streptomyces sp. NPDC059104 TaxID=3346729 RepID=UPI003673882C
MWDQVERTRDELGKTVEALAAKADIKAQAKEKTAAVKGHAAEKAALVSDQIRETAGQAAQLVKDMTPARSWRRPAGHRRPPGCRPEPGAGPAPRGGRRSVGVTVPACLSCPVSERAQSGSNTAARSS